MENALSGTLEMRDGIEEASCRISPFGSPDTNDLDPAAVTSVTVIELDGRLRVADQTDITDDFRDGDKIEYTSISSGDLNGTFEFYPRALQLNIFADNAVDQLILNNFIITYSNFCNATVFSEVTSVGWVDISTKEDAEFQFCPVVPTVEPTTEPTRAPVEPTEAPVVVLTEPTVEPISPPATDQPSIAPVEAPGPTPTPVTVAPTMSMSMRIDHGEVRMLLEDEDLFEATRFDEAEEELVFEFGRQHDSLRRRKK